MEVFHGGRWGVICDNDWGDSDATVVCRMLGYNGPSEATRQHYTTEEFSLDHVDCDGDEAQIHACSHSGWGSHNCHANEGAGVICSNVGGKALVVQILSSFYKGLTPFFEKNGQLKVFRVPGNFGAL